MSRFTHSFAILIITLVSIFSFGACSTEEVHDTGGISSMDHHQQADAPPTSTIDAAEAHARSASKATGYGAAWVLNIAGIGLLPLIIIFAIPGFLFGRAEKMVEGVLLTAIGVFFMYIADTYHLDHLWICALLVNLLPGIALFIWGVVSGEEKGKLVVVGVPLFGMGFWLLAMCWEMLTKGLIIAPIMTFLIIIVKLVLFALIFGGSDERSTARA